MRTEKEIRLELAEKIMQEALKLEKTDGLSAEELLELAGKAAGMRIAIEIIIGANND